MFEKIKISFINTKVALSCEDYTNKGATYEMYEEIIESIDVVRGFCKLVCERSGINDNPAFIMPGNNKDDMYMYIYEIEIGIRHKLGLPILDTCNSYRYHA